MTRTCTICDREDIDEIDRRARIENDIASIAKEFSLSYPALYRHISANHHIREVTAIPTSSELATSEDIYKEIEKWHTEAKDLQKTAKNEGDIKVALLGLDKALRCLELMLKIHGHIQEQNINVNLQQVSIYQSPEWCAVGDILVRVLAGYPELKSEIAQEFKALERGAK
jgi:hypothetical protein